MIDVLVIGISVNLLIGASLQLMMAVVVLRCLHHSYCRFLQCKYLFIITTAILPTMDTSSLGSRIASVLLPFWICFAKGNISRCNGCKGRIRRLSPPGDIVLQHKERVLFLNPNTGVYQLSCDYHNVYYHAQKSCVCPHLMASLLLLILKLMALFNSAGHHTFPKV